MPEHSATATLEVKELGNTNSALTLKIYADDSLLGTINIGKGTFRWRNSNGRFDHAQSWTNFFKLLNDNAGEFTQE